MDNATSDGITSLVKRVELRRVELAAHPVPEFTAEAAAAGQLLDLLIAAGVASGSRARVDGRFYTFRVEDEEHNMNPAARRGAADLTRGHSSLTEPGMSDRLAGTFRNDLPQIAAQFCRQAATDFLADTNRPALRRDRHYSPVVQDLEELQTGAAAVVGRVSEWAQARASMLAPVKASSEVVFKKAAKLVPAARWLVPTALGAFAIGGGVTGADTVALAVVALPLMVVTSVAHWRHRRQQTRLFRARLDPDSRAAAISDLGSMAAPGAATLGTTPAKGEPQPPARARPAHVSPALTA